MPRIKLKFLKYKCGEPFCGKITRQVASTLQEGPYVQILDVSRVKEVTNFTIAGLSL
jgi:hypothetical protein